MRLVARCLLCLAFLGTAVVGQVPGGHNIQEQWLGYGWVTRGGADYDEALENATSAIETKVEAAVDRIKDAMAADHPGYVFVYQVSLSIGPIEEVEHPLYTDPVNLKVHYSYVIDAYGELGPDTLDW